MMRSNKFPAFGLAWFPVQRREFGDSKPTRWLDPDAAPGNTGPKVPERCLSDGESTKALWKTHDGLHFESVLLRPRGRATLCVSSQAGCALGCVFCATGRAGWHRDLTVDEILAQATWAEQRASSEGTRLRNVVFMGMGEPLLALDSVGPALRSLMDQRTFEIAPRYLSVSTSGVAPAIDGFARDFPLVKLAVSLHAARQDLRDQLMPGCRSWPLTELMPTLDRYAATTRHRLFFEYILIAGVNDGERELHELLALLERRDAHVNLIPCNPSTNMEWQPSPPAVIERFRNDLRAAGHAVTVRRSAGDAIRAACGQLAADPA